MMMDLVVNWSYIVAVFSLVVAVGCVVLCLVVNTVCDWATVCRPRWLLYPFACLACVLFVVGLIALISLACGWFLRGAMDALPVVLPV